jgi:integrase/recombinase XerD
MDTAITQQNSPLLPADPAALDQRPAAVYLAGLGSPISRTTQHQALCILARLLTGQDNPDPLMLNWGALRYGHVVALRAVLIQRYAPATVNRLLSTLRGVLREAYLLRQLDGDEYQRLVTLKGVSGNRLPTGRELSADEIARLIDICKRDRTPAGARDLALLAVLYAGGLRRAEVCALNVADVDFTTGRIIIQRGKGNKQRIVYLAGGALLALRVWLKRRGGFPGALFVAIRKDGVIGHKAISTTALYNALQKRADQAGIDPISPHDLRRTHVSRLLAAGADMSLVSKIVGHADPKTTARYDRRPDDAKRDAAELIDFPYDVPPELID